MLLSPAALDLQREKSTSEGVGGGFVLCWAKFLLKIHAVRENEFLSWLKRGIWDEML